FQALARRRESNWTLAIMTQASALAMVASKSLARRRLRPSQAKVRPATQRRDSGLKVPMLWGLVTISIVHLPRSASASSSFGPRSDRRRYEWRSPRRAVRSSADNLCQQVEASEVPTASVPASVVSLAKRARRADIGSE